MRIIVFLLILIHLCRIPKTVYLPIPVMLKKKIDTHKGAGERERALQGESNLYITD